MHARTLGLAVALLLFSADGMATDAGRCRLLAWSDGLQDYVCVDPNVAYDTRPLIYPGYPLGSARLIYPVLYGSAWHGRAGHRSFHSGHGRHGHHRGHLRHHRGSSRSHHGHH